MGSRLQPLKRLLPFLQVKKGKYMKREEQEIPAAQAGAHLSHNSTVACYVGERARPPEVTLQ